MRRLLPLLAASVALCAAPVRAQTPAQLEALQAQLRAVQQQLDELRAQMEQQRQQSAGQQREIGEVKRAQAEAPAPAPAPAAKPDAGGVNFPNGRPTLSSNDGRFSLGITGRIHFDVANYFEGNNKGSVPTATEDLNSGSNFRRARLGVIGRAFEDFEYALIYDFGGSPDNTGSIDEARLAYLGIKNTALELGAFKPSLTLEDSISSNDISFLERASVVNIATSLAAGTARNAVGGRTWGDRYFLGAYLTGGATGVEADDEQRSGTLRGAFLPWRDDNGLLHLGASGSYLFKPNETNGSADSVQLRDRPELRVDSNRLIDTGLIDTSHAQTLGGELAVAYRSLSLQGEYIRIGVDRKTGADVDFDGWYVMGSWVLTGEKRSYANSRGAFGTVRPAKPLDLDEGGWGAFELVARYSTVDLDDRNINGGEQDIITAGLNWYMNNNFRLMFNYQYVDVDRRNAAGLQIGQNYHAVSMRAQANW